MADKTVPAGAAFLLEPPDPKFCATPEDLSDEHRMIFQTTLDFVNGEVAPVRDALETTKDINVIRKLFAQAGELGLLGTDVPEEFGGLGLDKMSTCMVTDAMGEAGPFAVTMGAHTGIGTLPIVYYGNQQQKEKYLPGLASGERIGAYALTESSAGSDAVGGCRTKAVLSDDGKHYILNGEKIFITNGGWADSFIVFAKIDGADFSAFIVEREMEGVSSGKEEKKLGIHGSSTTPLILEDAKVPAENLLYERGKGHHIALNVLNIGRYKLGAGTVGGMRASLRDTVAYAAQRRQFGKSIIDFGMMREKLAHMATLLYGCEAACYRTVGLIDAALENVAKDAPDYSGLASQAIRGLAVECAICKVFCSEALDTVVDEGVQILGGYGYTQEFSAERNYRDARINRIFEGTNEINRMLVPGEIMKKALKGQLPFMQAGQKLLSEIMDYSPRMVELGDEPLAYQAHMVEMCKKAVIYTAGLAMQKLMQKLGEEQEILGRLADMIIQTFVLESSVVRAQKAGGGSKAGLHAGIAMAAVDQALPRIHAWGNQVLAYLDEGDELRTALIGLRKLLKYEPQNIIALNREIAQAVVDKGGYPISVI